MAEGVYTLREAHARLSARRVGMRPEQPNTTQAQLKGAQAHAETVALPKDTSKWQPLQVTSGPNIGLFYFIPDFDTPGDPTKVIR